MPGMKFRYRCRSEPQIAVDVTFKMTSSCRLQAHSDTTQTTANSTWHGRHVTMQSMSMLSAALRRVAIVTYIFCDGRLWDLDDLQTISRLDERV